MPKAGSKDLFNLIKALNKSEKRYFKSFVNKKLDSDNMLYMKLFDLMNEQEDYNEEEILKELSPKTGRHFSSLKNFTYEMVHKSLRAYHGDKLPDAKLYNLLLSVHILFNKQQYKQCFKLLQKAKNLANNEQERLVLLEIARWENHLNREISFQGVIEQDITSHLTNQLTLVKEYQNECEYRTLNARLTILLKQAGTVRNIQEMKKLDDLMSHPLLKDEKKPLTFFSKGYFYDAHYFYHRIKGETKKSYPYIKKLVSIVESDTKLTGLSNYIVVLHNLLITLLRLKKYDDFHEELAKLKAIPIKYKKRCSENSKAQVIIDVIYAESGWYIETGTFQEAIPLLPENIEKFESVKNRFDPSIHVVFYFQMAYLFFGGAKPKDALIWMNKLLNETTVEIREDIHCFARIFNLILHFELGNEDLLEYIVKSTYRFLFKRKRIYKMEGELLNFIRIKLPKVKSNSELIVAFEELKNKLITIFKDPFEQQALTYFDFISWLESKIQNRPFADIVKEKKVGTK